VRRLIDQEPKAIVVMLSAKSSSSRPLQTRPDDSRHSQSDHARKQRHTPLGLWCYRCPILTLQIVVAISKH
jgi:hypothetical protein